MLLSVGPLEQFLNAITLELRASLLAGGLRFHFFLCCLVVHGLYRTTTIQKSPFKTVLSYNYPPRVEIVQYIRRYYCPFFLPALRSTLLARDPYSTQVAHELHGYIYTMILALRGATRHWGYILMQSYLQHQDIDGHLLRLYICFFFSGDTYIRNVTERQFLAQPECRKDKDHQQRFRFCFCALFLFHGRLETRIKMIHNLDHHRSPY